MYKRIVIKVGTNLLTDSKGIKKDFLKSLVSQASALHAKGKQVIIVSSGAIGAGTRKLGMDKKPGALSEKQAVAAVGQIVLMEAYEAAFCAKGINVAQILLEHDDIKNKSKNTNARNTIHQLLEWKVIPIINENDTIATDEIKFGDNDSLAGIVGNLVDADLVIILTSVDGIYDRNPELHPGAAVIPEISDVAAAIRTIDTEGKTSMGVGGMVTKLEAARKLNQVGIPLVIANGNREGVVENIVSGNKEGTIIRPVAGKVDSRKRHILMAIKEKGRVKVDDGAKNALLNAGKSLLAVGIMSVSGEFSFGDAVEITGSKGEKIGKGITNYSSADLSTIMGKKNAEIKSLMGANFYGEVVHRDNLFIYK